MTREFKQYSNENGGTIGVHRVTKETEGSVLTLGGGAQDVKEGDTLLSTSNPSVFIVGNDDSLTGYSEDSDDSDTTPVTANEFESDDSDEDFDPSEENADTVRRYLERCKANGDRDEFNRVVAAEQADKNRRTALVDYDA